MSSPTLARLGKAPHFGAVVIVVALVAVYSIFDTRGFYDWFTIDNILHTAAILGFVAVGQSLMLIAREIDLSVGSVYGLAGIGFILIERALGIELAVVAVLAGAVAIGYLNAVLTLRARLSSMIVTLCALFFYRGVIYLWSGGSIPSLARDARDNWLVLLLGKQWLAVENAVLLFALVAVGFHLLMTRSRYGNQLYAVGNDQASAASRGVDVVAVKTRAFVACSVLAAAAALLTIADRPNTYVTMGFQYELEAIAAAIVGGCALTGGRGTIAGAILGSLIIVSARTELISMGAPPSWFISFVGLLLLLSVLFNRFISRLLLGRRMAQT